MAKSYSSSWLIWGNLLRFVPKNLLSYIVGILVSIKLPKLLSRPAKRLFVKTFKINMDEAEYPLDYYESMGAVFTRRLKEGIRPIGEGVVHPVDGILSIGGPITSDYLVQAKGKTYSIDEFLKEESSAAYKNGFSVTYYLCPTDYHRVHSPIDGEIVECTYIPGALWPVNGWSVENVSQLFCRNERLVLKIRPNSDPNALLSLVMVGATNVGKMTLAIDSQVVTNAGHVRLFHRKVYEKPIGIERGQELGTFHMGSTVVCLYSQGEGIVSLEKPVSQHSVRMGEPL